MPFSIAHINVNGFAQIADQLGRHHKLGREHFTPSMLEAWAREAEESFNDGRGCGFEIRAWDSVSGAPVEVVITATGYDVEEVNDE